ncbi:hypothetical protein JVU11DRAFT_4708 [Chiua virens]|nr:hypothetical protein JVU11DRAFT_4708 [Chiua virens]
MQLIRLSAALVVLAISIVPVAHAAPAVVPSAVCQALGEVVGVVNGVVDNVESKLLGRADSAPLAPPSFSTTPSPATTGPPLATSSGATIVGTNVSTVSPSVPRASSNSRIQSRRQLPPLPPSLVPSISKIQPLQSALSAVRDPQFTSDDDKEM